MTLTIHQDSGLIVRYKLAIALSAGTITFTERNCIEASAYPRIISVSDIPEDSDDLQRIMFELEQKGPYHVSGVNYWRLEELFRAFPPNERSATITLRVLNGPSSSERTLAIGRVMPPRYTQTTVRLEVEPRQDLTKVKAPQRSINNDLFTTDEERQQIPETSLERAMPMCFGDPFPYICPLYRNASRNNVLSSLMRYGVLIPQGFPMLEFQRRDVNSTFALAESHDGELSLPLSPSERSTVNPMRAMAWVSPCNSWGTVWDQADSLRGGIGEFTTYTSGGSVLASTVKVARQPYMIATRLAAEWVEAESDTIVDPKYAIDGKQETYAVIANTANQWVSWECAPVSGLGHICANSVDKGTSGGGSANNNFDDQAPAGLQVYAVLCFPIAATPTSGTIEIGFKFPGATQDTAFGETSYSVFNLATAGMSGQYTYAVIAHNLRVALLATGATGNAADGWYGTKWANGDLTSVIDPVGADTLLGSDLPLVHTGTREVTPMRCAIKSSLNQGVGIVATGVRFGFVSNPLNDWIRIDGALADAARKGRDFSGRKKK